MIVVVVVTHIFISIISIFIISRNRNIRVAFFIYSEIINITYSIVMRKRNYCSVITSINIFFGKSKRKGSKVEYNKGNNKKLLNTNNDKPDLQPTWNISSLSCLKLALNPCSRRGIFILLISIF